MACSIHFLDLEGWNHHALNDIGEQGSHVIVAHGHVCNNLLERYLLPRKVLVLFVALEFSAQLRDFALHMQNNRSIN
jgi:hypothetical protein